ncbi:Glycerophosphoryl diester phosphodiesterase [Oxalobacteraceae bacterium IMCC9480]|nr:Glycerophosphoryl diester phosphodiesterase [Oxalobacteraceae bacterium IMCC9480]NDP58531.1 glycerophosphodiester phosphodiesterase [Oxalobacteraceae bacterium]
MKNPWPFPRIIAHRGGGTLAPENTLAAMRCGLAHGFRAVEFDVMLAQDGVPILMHDEQFGRTVAGSGAVATTSSSVLSTMDAGSWFGAAFAGELVPTYQQVIRFCHQHSIWMNVEIKPTRGAEQATGAAVAAMTQALLAVGQATPLLSSFSFEALQAARAVAPALPRGWLVEHIPADWEAGLRGLDATALHVDQKGLTAGQAAAVKAGGWGLFCYTVNSVERARELLSWGVDGFCTDRIDLIDARFA